jgi:YVTN family beta-propeller protein
MKYVSGVGFAVLAMAAVAAHTSEPGGRLLVAVKGEQSLAIVDPGTGTVIAKVSEQPVPGKDTGHEVAASLDGKLAYVPIYGDSGVGAPGSDGTSMVVVDIATHKIVDRVDFGRGVRPHLPVQGPAVPGHAEGLLYVTTEIDKTISVIDPKTMKIIGTVPTGSAESHMLAVSHDGKRGYTANVKPGTVSVLDLNARKVITIIPISEVTQRISISPDDHWVFTSDQTKPQLAVIDTTTNKIAKWIPMESTGYGTAPTPDGHWLLVPLMAVNKIAVIDLKTMTVARNIDLAAGTHPQEALVRPDGKVAYVSCDRSGQVAQIDLAGDAKDWKVARMIDVGKVSDGIAWAR